MKQKDENKELSPFKIEENKKSPVFLICDAVMSHLDNPNEAKKIIQEILSGGWHTINVTTGPYTPIFLFAQSGKHEAVEFILKNYAVNVNNALFGYASATPWKKNEYKKHMEVLIRNHGADKDNLYKGVAFFGDSKYIEDILEEKKVFEDLYCSNEGAISENNPNVKILKSILYGYALGMHIEHVEKLLSRIKKDSEAYSIFAYMAITGYAQNISHELAPKAMKKLLSSIRSLIPELEFQTNFCLVTYGAAKGGHLQYVKKMLELQDNNFVKGFLNSNAINGFIEGGHIKYLGDFFSPYKEIITESVDQEALQSVLPILNGAKKSYKENKQLVFFRANHHILNNEMLSKQQIVRLLSFMNDKGGCKEIISQIKFIYNLQNSEMEHTVNLATQIHNNMNKHKINYYQSMAWSAINPFLLYYGTQAVQKKQLHINVLWLITQYLQPVTLTIEELKELGHKQSFAIHQSLFFNDLKNQKYSVVRAFFSDSCAKHNKKIEEIIDEGNKTTSNRELIGLFKKHKINLVKELNENNSNNEDIQNNITTINKHCNRVGKFY